MMLGRRWRCRCRWYIGRWRWSRRLGSWIRLGWSGGMFVGIVGDGYNVFSFAKSGQAA